MPVTTAKGTRAYIGPTSSVNTITQYAALSYVEINEIENLGEFGDQFNIVTAATLKDGRQRKAKGTRDAGDLTMTVLANEEDPGQIAMLAAFEEGVLDYAFKVEEPNKVTPSGHGVISYFRAKVTSKRKVISSVDEYIRINFNVAINSDVKQVAAT